MLKAALKYIKVRTSLEKIYFVLFDGAALKVFEDTYQKLTARSAPSALWKKVVVNVMISTRGF